MVAERVTGDQLVERVGQLEAALAEIGAALVELFGPGKAGQRLAAVPAPRPSANRAAEWAEDLPVENLNPDGIVCTDCGVEWDGSGPFRPRADRPWRCPDCYKPSTATGGWGNYGKRGRR